MTRKVKRVDGQRTEKEIIACARNWRIRRLRGLVANVLGCVESREIQDAIIASIDLELQSIGARTTQKHYEKIMEDTWHTDYRK